MPFPDRLRQITVRLAVASGAAFGVAEPAAADDYDMDCKLILCVPAGFPSGCSDAFDHMTDRLRDGKSPIGFCAMSDGTEFSDYDLDHRFLRSTSASAWECPEGTMLSHSVDNDDDRQQVTAFSALRDGNACTALSQFASAAKVR